MHTASAEPVQLNKLLVKPHSRSFANMGFKWKKHIGFISTAVWTELITRIEVTSLVDTR